MGKIRVKTFDESGELQDDKKRAKYEARRAARQEQSKQAKSEELPEQQTPEVVDTAKTDSPTPEAKEAQTEKAPKTTGKAKFATQKKSDSKRHQSNQKIVEKDKSYTVSDAVALLKKFKTSSFDETVELHINVSEKGISGQVTLPHGTGKKLRIVVAEDSVIDEINAGKINFDVLVAKPEQMPKLAKVARILGPRGLMPNPKNGTVSSNPDEVISKLSAGQVSFKTEAKDPVMHLSVGKVSFEADKIQENVNTFIDAIGTSKINQAVLKSTMSPAIRLAVK